MKGFNLSSWVDPGTLLNWMTTLVGYGADTFRYQFSVESDATLTNRPLFNSWLGNKLIELDYIAAESKVRFPKVKIIADLHSPFGGVISDSSGVYNKCLYDDYCTSQWQGDVGRIAAVANKRTAVLGIEPINEPMVKKPAQWSRLAKKVVQVARASYNGNVILSGPGIGPSGIELCPSFNRNKVIYTTHFWPKLSLAGILSAMPDNLSRALEKKTFLDDLTIAARFKQSRNVRLFIGEVGCADKIGVEGQQEYFRLVLRRCAKLKLDVLIHPALDGQPWNYSSNGILSIFRDEL